MQSNGKKLIIIGIDGGSWRWLKAAIERGDLPKLAKLWQASARSILESTIPPNTCPAGPALYTGKNPGKLGAFGFKNPDRSMVKFEDIPGKTLWDYLNVAGLKTLVLNMPMTHPPRPLNGIMVSDFPTSFEHEAGVYPPELVSEIGNFHPPYAQWRALIELAGRDTEAALEQLTQMTRHEHEIFNQLMHKHSFSFAIFWLANADAVNHFGWHRQDLILKFYKAVEDIIAQTINNFPEHELLIVSDHGAEPAASYRVSLNTLLYKAGLLKLRGGFLGSVFYRLVNILRLSAPGWALGLAKSIKRKSISNTKITPNIVATSSGMPLPPIIGLDKEDSLAFSDPYSGLGIRLNNRLDGEQAAVIKEKVIKLLKDAKHRGKALAQSVWLREDLYHGPFTSRAPDVVYHANGDFMPDHFLRSSVFSKVKKTLRSGSHIGDREGVFLAHGQSFNNGEFPRNKVEDLTPTVLHYFGLPIPQDMDGRVIESIFKDKKEVELQKTVELVNDDSEFQILAESYNL